MKRASANKGAAYGEITRHKEQIQSVLKVSKTCVDPFLGAARSTTKRPEFRVSIFNGLLSSRAKSKEYLE